MRIFSLTYIVILSGLLWLSCSALAQAQSVNSTQIEAADGLTQALDTFGLGISGQGPFAWERSETNDNGDILYYNLRPTDMPRGKYFNIDKAELRGVAMVNGEAVFSKVRLSGLAIKDDDVDLTIRSATFTKPSAAIFRALGAAIRQDDAYEFSLDGMGFSSLSLYGGAVTVKTHYGNINGKLRSILLSGISDKKARSITVSGVSLSGPMDNGAPFEMSLGKFTLKGVNTQKYISLLKALKAADERGAAPDLAAIGYDPYATDYERFALTDFKGALDGIALDLPALTADVSDQGPLKIVTQTLAPATLSVGEGGEATQKLKAALTENGFDALTMSSRSVTFMDPATDWIGTSSRVTLKDGFTLDMAVDIGGIGAFTKALIEAGGEPDEAVIGGLNIQSVDLTLTDHGLTEKAIAFAAKEQEITPEEMRSNLEAMLTLASNSQLKGKSKAQGRRVIKTLSRFVKNPNVIQFGILPLDGISPIDIAQAMETGDISALGFYALSD